MTRTHYDNIEFFSKLHRRCNPQRSAASILNNRGIDAAAQPIWYGSAPSAKFDAMAKPVPIGARGESEEVVKFEHTLTAHHRKLPPVYSTPDMIRLMEVACFLALQPYAEGDELNVGTAINVEHRAVVGIGAKVKAQAVLQLFDGRFYAFEVRAWAEQDGQPAREIGRGTINRAFVNLSKFASAHKR